MIEKINIEINLPTRKDQSRPFWKHRTVQGSSAEDSVETFSNIALRAIAKPPCLFLDSINQPLLLLCTRTNTCNVFLCRNSGLVRPLADSKWHTKQCYALPKWKTDYQSDYRNHYHFQQHHHSNKRTHTYTHIHTRTHTYTHVHTLTHTY